MEHDNDYFESAFKLVATIWNNRIQSYQDVTKRLNRMVCICPTQDNPEEAMVYAHLFLTHFHRWLQGEGHPRELVGTFITEETYQEGLESLDTVRPRLFWNAIADVEVLPVVGNVMMATAPDGRTAHLKSLDEFRNALPSFLMTPKMLRWVYLLQILSPKRSLLLSAISLIVDSQSI